MEKSITYFEHRGMHNTDDVLALVKARAAELDIKVVVLPSTGGPTGLAAVEVLSPLRVVVVTHSTGYSEAGHQEVPVAVTEEMRAKGAAVLTGTHAFGGLGRAVRRKFGTWQIEEIIAQTLKRFSEGLKVAVEVSLMAADAGLIPAHEEIISCGGTGHGLDTALVIHPVHAQNFFDIEIREIICKPRVP
jgi:uncharacterized protein